jgi:hypothetical protein
MKYVNRWSVSCLWVAAMIGGWFALVPGVLSTGSWVIATVGGPVLLVGVSAFLDAGHPTPSFGQSRAVEEAEAAQRHQG